MASGGAISTAALKKNIVTYAGDWGSFSFYVKPSSILGVKDINITVSIETENKTAGNENYTSRKNYNPAEITLTGVFSRVLGIKDVKAKSWELMNIIRLGQKGYMYCGSEKLIAPMVMGTTAKTTKIEIGPDNKWWYCEVTITLKQCEKYGGGTSGSKKKKSSSKRKSTKSSSTKKTTKTKSSIYNLSSERKKQIEQAKQKAKETAKGAAKASINKKLVAAGKTTRAVAVSGRRVAMTQ